MAAGLAEHLGWPVAAVRALFVILAVPSTDVLTTFSLRLLDYNYTQAANGVVLLICAISYVGTLAAQKLTRTNLAEGLGG